MFNPFNLSIHKLRIGLGANEVEQNLSKHKSTEKSRKVREFFFFQKKLAIN